MHYKAPQNLYCKLQYVKGLGVVSEPSPCRPSRIRTASMQGPQAHKQAIAYQATQERLQLRARSRKALAIAPPIAGNRE